MKYFYELGVFILLNVIVYLLKNSQMKNCFSDIYTNMKDNLKFINKNFKLIQIFIFEDNFDI